MKIGFKSIAQIIQANNISYINAVFQLIIHETSATHKEENDCKALFLNTGKQNSR